LKSADALLAVEDRDPTELDRAFASFYPELKKIARAREAEARRRRWRA
jgi:hypothetical protein